MRILFIGHSGYGYPHTRVRCYHFAKILSTMPGVDTGVLSFRDDLAPHKSEAAMYENLRDREKLVLTVKALRRLVQERNTIFYIQKAHFHAAAPFFLHRMGLAPRYIFDYDDYDIPLSNFFGRGILNRIFFGSNRWDEITYLLARNARGCVAASHELYGFLQKYNEQVAYIPTGVDDTAFSPGDRTKRQGPLTFLWNGLVWGEPILNNVLFLLRAYNTVVSSMPDTRLLLTGGGAEWQTLKDRAASEFSHLPVEFREWIKPEEMPNLLRSVDIGLLPVEGDDEWLRSKSPTKLFEYLASGLPVVATAVGEVSHVIDHLESGYLAREEKEFGEGMLRLARNPSMREQMGEQARQLAVDQYSLPVLGERLYLFLKELFGEPVAK